MLLLPLGIVLVIIYFYLKHNYDYWKTRGLHTPEYKFLVGNLLEQFMFKKHVAHILQDCYKSFVGYNYIGFYNALQPCVLVRNLEVIGDILVKDFGSFYDNDYDIDEKADPLFGNNPFLLKGQKWKHVRGQASPNFTTGKIKMMFPSLLATSTKLINYLNDNKEQEIFTLANKITSENVAGSAFGIESNCFTTKETDTVEAPFAEICNQINKPTIWVTIKTFVVFFCPSLGRLIKQGIFEQETYDSLQSIVEQSLKYRQDNNIQRNDFLDDMKRLQEKINDENKFNKSDIVGHAGGLLIDGIFTSSAVMSNTIYEIANNQEVQDKLRLEIQEMLLKNNQLSHENVEELEYLECVFKESLRLNPAVMYLSKRVTKPYMMKPMREDNTGPRIQLEVGTPVIVPIYALHRDEKYFPEPDKFLPERFNKEHKDKIAKNSYLPFGDGPRICLGRKFAVLQIKMMMIAILSHFRITVNKNTIEPLKLNPTSFLNLPVGGHWIDFIKL